MNTKQIQDLLLLQIDNTWKRTNAHGVNLEKSLVPPQRITIFEQTVSNGKVIEKPVDVWLLLKEEPSHDIGYRIVAKPDGNMFGLVHEDLNAEPKWFFCGWYKDFMTAFKEM